MTAFVRLKNASYQLIDPRLEAFDQECFYKPIAADDESADITHSPQDFAHDTRRKT
ncbi:MAG: hypothetical protein NTW21_28055 [Verrucomicrobia bacterium]|nr:hypothetical protein [Verrucomicrobiota bacterium]